MTALLAAYADDAVFHDFGSTDLAGTHVGKDACVAAMAQTASRAHLELVEIVECWMLDEDQALMDRLWAP